MEVDQLTDEQIANLTPEQIEELENDPSKVDEILGKQAAKDESKPEVKSVANDADKEEPVVLNKSGKGIIPYEKHKELRVENSALREQLQSAQAENAKATEKLESLLKAREAATTGKDEANADDAIAKHLATLKNDMPELHEVITSVLKGSREQGEKLNETLQELKREKEESDRVKQLSVAEQVAEAKDNNPDLTHWESNDPEAWDEAMKQDEILRNTSKWAGKPYAERFEEVARRVRAIMPDASAPKKADEPEQTKAKAKAKLDAAPARKPTTLSDIQGGAPVSEGDEIANLKPHELTARLMKMSPQKAAAMRAELD
ncbi:hypothetical protein SAMN05216428_102369 [Nitrosospira sp. Nsp11]|uniref:hypothetical protein n=1 Tax=Nitrosospira sp. Nsp11 TaxID=1855338 RepID=UPI0009180A4C|nr:hypothetical protein [Nitrosospira sp. Nsp11]SHL42646.1 hypothetical protein SAMN05216428_102369 [Nitrosospira sp. Nsp11]